MDGSTMAALAPSTGPFGVPLSHVRGTAPQQQHSPTESGTSDDGSGSDSGTLVSSKASDSSDRNCPSVSPPAAWSAPRASVIQQGRPLVKTEVTDLLDPDLSPQGRRSSVDLQPPPVHCQLCGMLFLDPEYYQQHIEDVHGLPKAIKVESMQGAIQCVECSQWFSSEASLRSHILKTHRWNEQAAGRASATISPALPSADNTGPSTTAVRISDYRCTLCTGVFASGAELLGHVQAHHSSDSSAIGSLLKLGVGAVNVDDSSLDLSDRFANGDDGGSTPPPTATNGAPFGRRHSAGGKVFNPEAYCELCHREFCNKYFLKTHRANKHGLVESGSRQQRHSLDFTGCSLLLGSTSDGRRSKTPSGSKQGSTSSENGDAQLPPRVGENLDLFRQVAGAPLLAPKAQLPTLVPCAFCGQGFPSPYLMQAHVMTMHSGMALNNLQTMYAMSAMMGLNPTATVGVGNPLFQAAAMMGVAPPLGMALVPPPPRPGLPGMMTLDPSAAAALANAPSHLEAALNGGFGASASRNGMGKASPKQGSVPGSTTETVTTDVNGVAVANGHAHNSETFCELCRKEFCNKYFLRSHKWNKHGIAVPADDDPSHLPRGLLSQTSPHTAEATQETPLRTNVVGLASQGASPLHEALLRKVSGDASVLPPPVTLPKSEPVTDASISDFINQVIAAHPKLNGESSPTKNGGLAAENGMGGTLSVDPDAYCEICKKEFCSKYFLKTHKLNIHGIIMDVPSQVYGKDGSVVQPGATSTTPTPNGVGTNGLPNGSPPSGKKNFCDLCNKELCNKYFLRTHMAKMHGLKIDENKVIIGTVSDVGRGGYRCDVCNKELSSRHFLQVHRLNQHGIKAERPTMVPENLGAIVDDVSGVTKEDSPIPAGDRALRPMDMTDLINSRYFSHYTEVCLVCDRRFKSSKWLRHHMWNEHQLRPSDLEGLRTANGEFGHSSSEDHSGPTSPIVVDQTEALDFSMRPKSTVAQSAAAIEPPPPSQENAAASAARLALLSSSCDYCGEMFDDRIGLEMHVIGSHQREIQEKTASLANQAAMNTVKVHASSLSTPATHEQPQHPVAPQSTSDATVSSPVVCGTTGSQPTSHAAGDESSIRWYRCSYCDYSTKWMSNLCVHERRHTGRKPSSAVSGSAGATATAEPIKEYSCRVCWRRYRYLSTLERHMVSVHRFAAAALAQMGAPPSMPGGCWSPPKRAASSLLLSSPLKRKLNASPGNAAERRLHACKHCGKEFGSKEVCRMHEVTAHSSPPAPSTVASSPTKQRRKLYRCKLCGFSSQALVELRQHLRDQHGHVIAESKESRTGPTVASPPPPASFVMQSFSVQPVSTDGAVVFGPGAVVYLPVTNFVSQPVQATFLLAPMPFPRASVAVAAACEPMECDA